MGDRVEGAKLASLGYRCDDVDAESSARHGSGLWVDLDAGDLPSELSQHPEEGA